MADAVIEARISTIIVEKYVNENITLRTKRRASGTGACVYLFQACSYRLWMANRLGPTEAEGLERVEYARAMRDEKTSTASYSINGQHNEERASCVCLTPTSCRGGMTQQTAGTILIVDDESGVRNALAVLLHRQGYTVATASNGALAWEHLHAQRYDVILCDLIMPEVDGQALYAQLQRHSPSLCSRVIFLTGDTMGAPSATFLRQCGQPWLYKPCGAAEVLQAIEQMLRTA
jgi:CheY-like chemotaxis protein